jgi:DNA repair protein RadA/Sms
LAKLKTVFICKECGNSQPKWLGKCPSCSAWNSFQEDIVAQRTNLEKNQITWKKEKGRREKAKNLSEISIGKTQKIKSFDEELNRVLGGGIVLGSLILIGGQPGIGKSTLMLQIALELNEKVMFVSGEESAEQIKMRALRINQRESNCYIYTETDLNKILTEAQNMSAELIIIDSIQTMSSPNVDNAPGSITQVRECTAEIQRFAKQTNIPVFIVGHINKEGALAGPKLLEHIVDVVLQFEGDKNYAFRILRTLKNRFGSTDEIGIYEMQMKGLIPVANPSSQLLSQYDDNLSGNAIAASLEGIRPLLIETQALVSPSVYGTPQRSATGFDLRRLSMLLAVLEKRSGLQFGHNDVFLNIAGGIKAMDPSTDLAIIAALISSLQDIPIAKDCCFAGEVGLSGEIRPVSRILPRIQEADRLGFKQIFISKHNSKGLDVSNFSIEIVLLSHIDDLLRKVFA